MNRTFCTIAVVFMATAVQAQDIRSQEIMIVDQACTERKLATCIAAEPIQLPFNQACPPGTTALPKAAALTPTMCKINDLTLVANNTLVKLDDRLPHCKMLVENFPSFYTGENCLKPLAQERLVNAVNVDLKNLIKQLCAVSGNPKCDELDKVPQ